MKRKNWYRLDNAAKIYPPTSNLRRPSVFAVSAILSEEIDKEILESAVGVVLNRFPTFKVKLNRGIFWYFLEENKQPFHVMEEPPFFLGFIDEKRSNGYLFKVYYRGNKITLSIFHALTDGTGALELLKAIIFEYLFLRGHEIKAKGGLKTFYSPSTSDEKSDKFLQVYDKRIKKPPKEKKAFKINGAAFADDGIGIITGKVKVEDLKRLSKQYGASITTFIAGLLTYNIYKLHIEHNKVKNKLVKVLIPVNMRNIYPTQTVRNFALFARPGHDFAQEISLDECIRKIDSQAKEGVRKETLDRILNSNVKTERNFFLKIMPLFIKDMAMKLAYSKVGDVLHTTTVSNLGALSLPESVQPYVKDIHFVLGTAYSAKTAVAVCGYDGYLNITFSREFVENSLEKAFFTHLTDNNVSVEISSNYWESEL